LDLGRLTLELGNFKHTQCSGVVDSLETRLPLAISA